MFDALAIQTIGIDAKLQAGEHFLIDPALRRIMERSTPETLQRYSTFMDPVILAMGLGFWGLRISAISKQKREDSSVPRSERVAASGGIDSNPTPTSISETWNKPASQNGKADEVAPASPVILSAISEE